MARKHYDDTELETVDQKLGYEVDMLVGLAREWRESDGGPLPEFAPPSLHSVPAQMCASTLASGDGIRLFQGVMGRAPRSRTLHNAILEAFLLHFRCLAEFLLEKKDGGGAVRSFHFFPNNAHSWTENLGDENLPRVKEQIDDWRHEASQHLAHLSAERIAYKPRWPVGEMKEKLLSLLSAFVKALPDERKAWFGRF